MLMYYRDIFYQFTGNLIIVRSFVGNLIVKVVGLLETDIVPLCCSIIFLQNGKPSQKLMPLKLTTHTNYNLGISY